LLDPVDSLKKINKDLKHSGVRFKTGPFNIAVTSNIPSVAKHIHHFYRHYQKITKADFVDFHVEVNSVGGYRRFYKPQVTFVFDGYEPFIPLPIEQAPAMFEWGLNWCVANVAHQYLIIHSAIIEKDGRGLILPGTPGSGKSTLCAALVNQGWRLLSDEMALLSITDGLVYPAPRPVSLKNKSIQIIKQFAPNAIFGDVVMDTLKGDISHMVAAKEAIVEQEVPVKPALLVFPHYQENSKKQLIVQKKSRALMALGEHAFNFNVLGDAGFDCMANLVEQVDCYDFTYSDLESALSGINSLV